MKTLPLLQLYSADQIESKQTSYRIHWTWFREGSSSSSTLNYNVIGKKGFTPAANLVLM